MRVAEKAVQNNPRSREDWEALAGMVMRLFSHWDISLQDQEEFPISLEH